MIIISTNLWEQDYRQGTKWFEQRCMIVTSYIVIIKEKETYEYKQRSCVMT